MKTNDRIVILFRRKKTGVCKNQQYHSGKKYIDKKVRLIP
jgi:hypothetical protein